MRSFIAVVGCQVPEGVRSFIAVIGCKYLRALRLDPCQSSSPVTPAGSTGRHRP